MGRRGATIGAAGLLAACAAGGSFAFGQAAQPPAAARKALAPAEVQAAPAQPQAAPANPGIDLETLLKRWEGQSSKLKTLDVVIFRRDDVPAFDEVEYYEGRALFKSPNLAFIDFKKIKQDDAGKPVKKDETTWDSTHEERIICTGNEVWQYKSDTRQIFVFPLEKDQAAKAIEEGPLPFLFNMKAEEAKQRYEIGLMPPPNDKSFGISIKPKLDVDKESFSHAFVQLDRAYMLPVRIVLVSPDGKSKKDFKLESVKPNATVKEENFVGKEFAKWKVIRNPAGEERPRNAPPAAAARPVPAAAAPRR
ncbi:outer membrane lipoprotein-sorting protein [Paludisphaera mucosa]|uniref:Outer membrane lipoprotein-sorting protein n=1 Tax=Paludisphaera mucosa TaxID=3030827 RepID=A0ABT6F5W2_9BACT|nr:outer membrane lipoprotein-sorting protein [Paludisphaera mucosa]MDG3002977.1 outer membrane lipoprotein-sorting protein [Paludisphaera mucosa]